MKQGLRQALFRLITKLQQQEKELFTFYFTFTSSSKSSKWGKDCFGRRRELWALLELPIQQELRVWHRRLMQELLQLFDGFPLTLKLDVETNIRTLGRRWFPVKITSNKAKNLSCCFVIVLSFVSCGCVIAIMWQFSGQALEVGGTTAEAGGRRRYEVQHHHSVRRLL